MENNQMDENKEIIETVEEEEVRTYLGGKFVYIMEGKKIISIIMCYTTVIVAILTNV